MRDPIAKRLEALGYVATADRTASFETAEGTRAVEVLDRGPAQIRELRSRLMGLAIRLGQDPHLADACLVMRIERMSEERLDREWRDMLSTLRPGIARRLSLVAVGPSQRVCLPEPRPWLEGLPAAAGEIVERSERELPRRSMPSAFAILQVLLVRWLLGQGSVSRKELGELAGCTYPTIAAALRRIGRAVHVESNRSVELRSFPQRAWSELLALSSSLRGSMAYLDGTGRDPDLDGLLRRLRRLRPANVALGGVLAGHHWDAHFDLQGLPRLDLAVHAPNGLDLDFVRKLDPGLVLAPPEAPAPALVVHPVRRPVALFTPAPDGGLPYADPVETLLDLSELRLPDQGSAMIDRLRARAESTALPVT